jgi:iron complex outermembrane receptor protein
MSFARKTTPVVAGLLLSPILAAAAEPAAPSDPAPSTNSPVWLPAVIVTAQKEPATLQSLPLSVTPITAATLQADDIRYVKDAEMFAPNVFVNEFSARKLSNPYFRGVGSSPNNPGITTYIDGVPQLNANSSSLELVDVQQIEFARGPQGALFGRNTVGGLINITSRRPAMAWEGGLQGEYGNYNFQDIRLSLSGPIVSEQLGFSFAGGYSTREGYTQNDVTGNDLDNREAWFGKGQFLWTPVDGWEARLILSGEHARDGDYALGDLAAIRANPHHVAHDFEGFTRRDVLAPTLLLSRQAEAVELSSISGFVWWKTHDVTDLDYSPFPAATRDNEETAFQFSQELRLASAPDAPLTLAEDLQLKWQAGVFVFTQNYEQDAVNNTQPPFNQLPIPLSSRSQADLDDVGVGVYGQATLTAWEKLDFVLGLRGDYEDKSADLRSSYSPPVAPGTASSPNDDFSEFSPQFSLAYRLTPHHVVYGSVSRGYKAGGFNASSPTGSESYGTETSWNYELGAKTSWLEDRLALNLAAFYLAWDDLQINLPTGAPGQYYIANAGAADSKGLELELVARPLAGWEIFGGIGYTDARFLGGAVAGHTDASGVDSTVDVGGNHLIYTPDFTAHGGMQYTWQVCRHAALYVRGEAVVYGRYFYNPLNTEYQDTYTLANFRAGLRGDHWFAEGWVRNAFDTEYVPIAFEFPNGPFGSGFVGESGAPVTFGLRAGLSF